MQRDSEVNDHRKRAWISYCNGNELAVLDARLERLIFLRTEQNWWGSLSIRLFNYIQLKHVFNFSFSKSCAFDISEYEAEYTGLITGRFFHLSRWRLVRNLSIHPELKWYTLLYWLTLCKMCYSHRKFWWSYCCNRLLEDLSSLGENLFWFSLYTMLTAETEVRSFGLVKRKCFRSKFLVNVSHSFSTIMCPGTRRWLLETLVNNIRNGILGITYII